MKDTFLTVAALWLKKKSSDFSLPRFSVVSSASQKNSVCFFYTDSSDSEKKICEFHPASLCTSALFTYGKEILQHTFVGLQFYDYFCEVAMDLCFSLFFFLIFTTQCQIFFYVSIKHHVQWNFSELRLINIYIINSKIKVILLSLVAFGSCHCFCIMN